MRQPEKQELQTQCRGGRRSARPLPDPSALIISDVDTEQVLRIADLASILRLRPASIYGLIKHDAFPKPIKLTNVQRGWLASDIRNWLRQRKAERDRNA
jgi:predicted DNA-binding transcriptional regulator AlpA